MPQERNIHPCKRRLQNQITPPLSNQVSYEDSVWRKIITKDRDRGSDPWRQEGRKAGVANVKERGVVARSEIERRWAVRINIDHGEIRRLDLPGLRV
jgi:hypothetical protein